MKQLKTVILLLLWVTSITGAYGQTEVNVSASLDSSRIFIGGQIDLTLHVSKPNGLSVKFPQLKDTIVKSIEVIEQGKIDTISSVNGRIEMIQKIRITSFDSGLHYIPPIQFEVWSSVSKSLVQTNELGLNVINPFEVVDPKKGFYDIKPVINTPLIFAEILPYLLWTLAIITVFVLLGYLYFKYRKDKTPLTSIFKNEVTPLEPHVKALMELERIKEQKIWQQNQEKRYYSELTDTLRIYIEERYLIPAMESTTDELIHVMNKGKIAEKTVIENLKSILQLSDLVKFAKYIPLPEENDKNLSAAFEFVKTTEPIAVVETEKDKKE